MIQILRTQTDIEQKQVWKFISM